jgi:hypothetical protein
MKYLMRSKDDKNHYLYSLPNIIHRMKLIKRDEVRKMKYLMRRKDDKNHYLYSLPNIIHRMKLIWHTVPTGVERNAFKNFSRKI